MSSQGSILLIEDDVWLADLYQDVLSHADFVVHHADSAEAALNLLDTHTAVDCIVLDIFLPSHNGIEFLHEFASYADISHIPVVVLSSVTEKELGMDAARWQQYGVTKYLYKPSTKPDVLLREVEDAVNLKKTEQNL